MIKVLKSRGIVFSAFLVCSFYYIISYKEERHSSSSMDLNLWTEFVKLRENKLLAQYPKLDLLTATITTTVVNESDQTVKASQNQEFQERMKTPEDAISEESDNLNEILKITASKIMDIFSPPDPLTKEELEDMRQQAIIDEQLLIQKEMETYTTNRNWTQFLTKNGGKPIRNVIFSTWRSGSTFLGEVVTSHPAIFYHYEPLLHFEIVQVRSGDLAKEGIRVLKNLLQCNYENLDEYMKYGEDHKWLHTHNWRLWRHCNNSQVCLEPNFLSEICQQFPFQIMKTVRMRLKLAEELLNDDSLDVKILFLVRDPRGTMQSRKHRDWCPLSPDCSKPKLLCSDMVDDYYAAIELREKYPDRLMIIRYEDLSLNPYNGVKKVFEFFRLDFHPVVKDYIKAHTGENLGGVSSTFRNSKTTPFRWINYFQDHPDELVQIQKDCRVAMKLWGYKPLNKSTLSKSDKFTPLIKPPWKEMIIPTD